MKHSQVKTINLLLTKTPNMSKIKIKGKKNKKIKYKSITETTQTHTMNTIQMRIHTLLIQTKM